MNAAKTMTLRARLRRVNRVTLAAALAIVAVVVVASSFALALRALIDSTRLQAHVLAENASAALLFQDAKAAKDLLQQLRSLPDLDLAQLSGADGRIVARYDGPNHVQRAVHAPPQRPGLTVSTTNVAIVVPVWAGGQDIGRLEMSLSLDALYRQTLQQVLALVLAALLAMVASRVLLTRLHATVLEPLADLDALMERVTGEADYSLRATTGRIEELNHLAHGFNDMLAQIQQRDASLAAHRDHLEDEVESRTVQLLRAKDAAEAASKAKSEFLATMSHEIRTPMNGVLGMNELLMHSTLTTQQRNWAAAVQASGQHLLNVINDILDFSKIESGHLKLERVDFNLVEVIEDALGMFAQPAADKALELAAQFNPPEGNWGVRGDPFRLRQVVCNLIGNAIKFTQHGEVVVRVTQHAHDDGLLRFTICVEDTGIGIAAEAQDKIFDHFSQADGSTTRRYGGTGLGLAISRRLLTLMAGRLRVDSELGHGSRFSIDLQLPVSDAPHTESVPLHALRGTRVLVVDDNATNREILQQQLQAWQMQVTCVAGGPEALLAINHALAVGLPFQLAVLDMHMPVMDGLALARAIKAQPACKDMRSMVLTSTCAQPDQQELHEAGVLRFINKPLRRTDLRNVITAMLAQPGSSETAQQPQHQPQQQPVAAPLLGSVLLVEDNPINQAVGSAMLARLGLRMTLAENGQVAMDLVRERDFDLVLMDCQMPVMDGFAATQAIRRLPGSRNMRLPIVALTANAMPGDEARCLDAGMNDFLAKPYSQAQLRETLVRWLPLSHASVRRVAEATPTSVTPWDAAPSLINREALNILRELDPNGGAELITQVLHLFFDSTPKVVAQLRAGVAAGDSDTVARTAHLLKSSAANVGAESLMLAYRELEKLGREDCLEQARGLCDTVVIEHERATDALREILAEVQA